MDLMKKVFLIKVLAVEVFSVIVTVVKNSGKHCKLHRLKLTETLSIINCGLCKKKFPLKFLLKEHEESKCNTLKICSCTKLSYYKE